MLTDIHLINGGLLDMPAEWSWTRIPLQKAHKQHACKCPHAMAVPWAGMSCQIGGPIHVYKAIIALFLNSPVFGDVIV